jgi:uncharacterized protein (DUF2236 family)
MGPQQLSSRSGHAPAAHRLCGHDDRLWPALGGGEADRAGGADARSCEGTTPDGVAYDANDPRLLDWVHATATFGFTEAYHQYVRPLSAAEKDMAFAEAGLSARLYGATGAPHAWAAWQAMLALTAPRLEGSSILADFMRMMAEAAILPAPMRWLQRLLVRAAVQITPEPVRSLPQLRGRGLRFGEATLVRVLAWASTLLPLGDTPPVQAARRLLTSNAKK